jgi:SAM-dependent methyltransferase
MEEILASLSGGARVLDLGCAGGSYDAKSVPAITVRVDLGPQDPSPGAFTVQADAARLPFRSAVFDAVICSHSLEHFESLSEALKEIGRTLNRQGALFFSVPDAGTITDKIYRWLARGGGHVNAFHSAAELAETVSRHASVPRVASRTLCTSFSFMNRKNRRAPAPRRMALFLWGFEGPLVLFNAALRTIDRWFRTRTCVYGWALYFGSVTGPVSTHTWTNVCVRCGQGHASGWLISQGAVSGSFFRRYRCPVCGAANFFTRDEKYGHLQL